MKLCASIIICFAVTVSVYAQTVDRETLVKDFSKDSTFKHGRSELDLIQNKFYERSDSLKSAYQNKLSRLDSNQSLLQSTLDSLTSPQRPTVKIRYIADSLNQLRERTLSDLNEKLQSIKDQTTGKLKALELPPELREEANKLTSMVSKLDITKPNVIQEYLNVPVPDLISIEGPNIPGVDLDNPLKDITNLDMPSVNIGDIGEQVKEYQNAIGELPTNLDGVTTLAEQQLRDVGEINNVQTELGKVGGLTQKAGMVQDEEKLKQQLIQEAQKQATDHFAGKMDQVDKAMRSISKHKQKFPTITSLNDIPRKAPNEMKGKPLVERIVPGMAVQLQKKDDDLLVDFNLYCGYRFTKRFTTGGGWNQRVGYNTDKNKWSPENARIYGPRIFSEYKLGKGFSPRLEIEVMNTFVPAYIKTIPVDPGNREWVWGGFVGIKKDYTLYKKVKGTAMVMIRLFDPHRKSPYADVINARFGFEFPMKKKNRAVSRN